MFRTGLAFVFGAVGFCSLLIGTIMVFLELTRLSPGTVWTWQYLGAGFALIWAAAVLYSLVTIEQQQAPAVVMADPMRPLRCADCGYANLADVERCAKCRRLLV